RDGRAGGISAFGLPSLSGVWPAPAPAPWARRGAPVGAGGSCCPARPPLSWISRRALGQTQSRCCPRPPEAGLGGGASSPRSPEKMAAAARWARLGLVVLLLVAAAGAGEPEGTRRAQPAKKKDIRDYNDADMARLLEQWEKDDDIEEGDLPEHKRPSAPIDFSEIDPSKPESILKMTKKGKTLMMFVTVSGNPTEKETEEITSLWQGSLFNANYDVQRFIVGSNRAIYMLRDGSYAWEIKDFLVNQERCADVTLEGQVYPGKGAEESEKVKNKTKQEKTKKKKDADKKSKPLKEDNRATKQREDL
ncbi:mesoderm development candidate 2, partial [Chelydra serpentina]